MFHRPSCTHVRTGKLISNVMVAGLCSGPPAWHKGYGRTIPAVTAVRKRCHRLD
jgi:hypothetical protein